MDLSSWIISSYYFNFPNTFLNVDSPLALIGLFLISFVYHIIIKLSSYFRIEIEVLILWKNLWTCLYLYIEGNVPKLYRQYSGHEEQIICLQQWCKPKQKHHQGVLKADMLKTRKAIQPAKFSLHIAHSCHLLQVFCFNR